MDKNSLSPRCSLLEQEAMHMENGEIAALF